MLRISTAVADLLRDGYPVAPRFAEIQRLEHGFASQSPAGSPGRLRADRVHCRVFGARTHRPLARALALRPVRALLRQHGLARATQGHRQARARRPRCSVATRDRPAHALPRGHSSAPRPSLSFHHELTVRRTPCAGRAERAFGPSDFQLGITALEPRRKRRCRLSWILEEPIDVHVSFPRCARRS